MTDKYAACMVFLCLDGEELSEVSLDKWFITR